jgi:hypothetical protein
MKRLILAAALAALAAPADARLQLSISDGSSTFTCFDGELSCDVSGGANNLLTIDTTLDGFFVQLTLTQSSFGLHNQLQLSSSNIENNGLTEGSLTLLASDTGFLNPAASIRESASLTFNSNVGAGLSTLKFWADPADVQGANPLNTPGALLDTVSGAAVTDPDSFSGSHDTAFLLSAPFSMTEGATLDLIRGGSITGFNQSMESSVPEPKTWVLSLVGFALLGAVGLKRARPGRFASL